MSKPVMILVNPRDPERGRLDYMVKIHVLGQLDGLIGALQDAKSQVERNLLSDAEENLRVVSKNSTELVRLVAELKGRRSENPRRRAGGYPEGLATEPPHYHDGWDEFIFSDVTNAISRFGGHLFDLKVPDAEVRARNLDIISDQMRILKQKSRRGDLYTVEITLVRRR